MFAYSDPVATGLLEQEGALQNYRELVHSSYRFEARKANSAFTLLSAFDDIRDNLETIENTVEWSAFPKISTGSDQEIDSQRFVHQDEYCEWRVERDGAGKITKITFTTELYEGLQALAEVGEDALIKGIKEIIPGADPTTEEMFGLGFDPSHASPDARGEQYVLHRRMNPWLNGSKGILGLGHRNNTGGALFTLVGDCAVNQHINPTLVCGISNCVPGRNSDPSVCSAVQHLSQADRAISLTDPAGIRIKELQGIWKINGTQIDINSPADNQGSWTVTRNGRRAVLDTSNGLTMGDAEIVSGAQVAHALFVEATVISAPENIVPAWARTGNESSRIIV